MDSRAFSRTIVSSTIARDSKGCAERLKLYEIEILVTKNKLRFCFSFLNVFSFFFPFFHFPSFSNAL